MKYHSKKYIFFLLHLIHFRLRGQFKRREVKGSASEASTLFPLSGVKNVYLVRLSCHFVSGLELVFTVLFLLPLPLSHCNVTV